MKIFKQIKWINKCQFHNYNTLSSSCAVERVSTSTSRQWSRKSWKTGDNFSLSLISGLPLVAIRYSALRGFSLRYGGSPENGRHKWVALCPFIQSFTHREHKLGCTLPYLSFNTSPKSYLAKYMQEVSLPYWVTHDRLNQLAQPRALWAPPWPPLPMIISDRSNPVGKTDFWEMLHMPI